MTDGNMTFEYDDNGEVTNVFVHIPDGRVIDVFEHTPFEISPNNPKFHSYEVITRVGYSSDVSALRQAFLFALDKSMLPFNPTTFDNVFTALRMHPAPSDGTLTWANDNPAVSTGSTTYVNINFPGVEDVLGDYGKTISEFLEIGTVTHTVNENENYIINVTQEDHILEPGIVVRVPYEIDGEFYILTAGIGNGENPFLNEALASPLWAGVDQSLQNLLTVFGEQEIPSNLSDLCFERGTSIRMFDGSMKTIEKICVGDVVLSFDGSGQRVGGTVKRVFNNIAERTINFHGTWVTPGHVYLTENDNGAREYKKLVDILTGDGIVLHENGEKIRAATGFPVGSTNDQFVNLHPISNKGSVQGHKIRIGTKLIRKSGEIVTVQECLSRIGARYLPELEMVEFADGKRGPLPWVGPLPAPEDFVLRMSIDQFASQTCLNNTTN